MGKGEGQLKEHQLQVSNFSLSCPVKQEESGGSSREGIVSKSVISGFVLNMGELTTRISGLHTETWDYLVRAV